MRDSTINILSIIGILLTFPMIYSSLRQVIFKKDLMEIEENHRVFFTIFYSIILIALIILLTIVIRNEIDYL